MLDPADITSAVAKRAEGLVGARLRVVIEPDLPMVMADAALIDQALFNLIENAILHGGQGEIILSARRDAGVVFEVMDEGPGLAPGDEARIFERFARGASPTASGTGLGLAIVRGFARLMGADVSAVNRDGLGPERGHCSRSDFRPSQRHDGREAYLAKKPLRPDRRRRSTYPAFPAVDACCGRVRRGGSGYYRGSSDACGGKEVRSCCSESRLAGRQRRFADRSGAGCRGAGRYRSLGAG